MLTRRRALATFGLSALGLAAAPPADPKVKPASAVVVDPATMRDPLAALLADARTGYARLRDYACTFTHQERIAGGLTAEQVAEMRVRLQPFSIAIRTARPESLAGQEMIYVARSRPDGKMKLRLANTAEYRAYSVDDPKVLALCRRPITQLGMGAILDILSEVVRKEKALSNAVEVYTSEYQFANRPVTRYEIFTRRPHAQRAFYRAVVCVDKETKLPVRFESYDQPRAGGAPGGELLEVYSYSDIRTNLGIGDSVFTR